MDKTVSKLPQAPSSCLATQFGWTQKGVFCVNVAFLTLPVQSSGDLLLVGAHQRETFEIEVPANSGEVPGEVPANSGELILSVEGDPNGFFLWGAPTFVPAGGSELPSLVLITLDTTRRDVLGAYGGAPGLTPALDALAAEATVFERAYAPSSWTLPSHASIFTGLYPSRHGAGVAGDHLEGRFTTVAELLRQRGYLTAGFAGGLLSSYRFGVAQGFSLFRDPTGFESSADEINSHARSLLADSGEQPLFLFINYFDPHFPYAAPKGFRAAQQVDQKIASVQGPELWLAALAGSSEAWLRVTAGEVAHSAEALDALGAAYRAEIAFTDQQLGKLFDDLRRNNRWQDSLIIVTADHGELLGEGGHVSHAARLDPELVEVPLIIKWPGQQQGARRDQLVSLVDLFPTLLRAAGIELPENIDGLPLQAAKALEKRSAVWMEEHDSDFHRLPERMRHGADAYGRQEKAFRQIAWEDGTLCARGGTGAWRPTPCPPTDPEGRQLFDQAGADAWRAQATRIGLSDEERSKLRALGYLQ